MRHKTEVRLRDSASRLPLAVGMSSRNFCSVFIFMFVHQKQVAQREKNLLLRRKLVHNCTCFKMLGQEENYNNERPNDIPVARVARMSPPKAPPGSACPRESCSPPSSLRCTLAPRKGSSHRSWRTRSSAEKTEMNPVFSVIRALRTTRCDIFITFIQKKLLF